MMTLENTSGCPCGAARKLSLSGPIFYLWLSKISANERRRYFCSVFSHWLIPCWASDRKWDPVPKSSWYVQYKVRWNKSILHKIYVSNSHSIMVNLFPCFPWWWFLIYEWRKITSQYFWWLTFYNALVQQYQVPWLKQYACSKFVFLFW